MQERGGPRGSQAVQGLRNHCGRQRLRLCGSPGSRRRAKGRHGLDRYPTSPDCHPTSDCHTRHRELFSHAQVHPQAHAQARPHAGHVACNHCQTHRSTASNLDQWRKFGFEVEKTIFDLCQSAGKADSPTAQRLIALQAKAGSLTSELASRKANNKRLRRQFDSWCDRHRPRRVRRGSRTAQEEAQGAIGVSFPVCAYDSSVT